MSHKMMVTDYPLDPANVVKSFDDILTPALLVYPDIIESNIDRTLHLLDGNADYGYEPVRVENPPGTKFSYSGGGFLVLEHLLESLERRDVQEQTARFLKEFPGLTFQQQTLPGHHYAHGFLPDGREVEGTRKMFPAFAAGAASATNSYRTSFPWPQATRASADSSSSRS